MRKIIRLTESDLTRIVKRVIEEQSWSDIGHVIAGPLSYLIPDNTWKKIISSSSPLFGVLSTNTGKQALNALISNSSAGLIKNMAISAANGDSQSFKQAFEQASKRAGTDVSALKNAAFQDMKSFGKLLQQGGIN